MTKERPILFSTAMVQALLEGRKTQTRRVVKDHAPFETTSSEIQESLELIGWEELVNGVLFPRCPYGKVGDRLWVRESFWQEGSYTRYKADGRHTSEYARWKPSIHMPRTACRLVLEITDVRVERLHDISADDAKAEGVPEDMTYVPVQIGQEAMEALKAGGHTSFMERMVNPPITQDWRQGFFRLWETINGKQSLEQNPWVWAVSFKVVTP